MTNSMMVLLPIGMLIVGNANGQLGVEQYCYLNSSEVISFVPLVTFENDKNWHLESRFNYEEENSFSLYFGKTFTYEKKLSASVTPLVGAVAGQYRGGSMGVNVDVEYRTLFYSMQSQYTFSVSSANEDFLFAWYEVGYQPFNWGFIGFSAQQTHLVQSAASFFEPGVFIGFTIGGWTFPMYSFSPGSTSSYFVMGANFKFNRLENKE